MQILKSVAVLIIFLFFSATAFAATECCPTPPICIPTLACPIEMMAGAVDDTPNATIEAISKGIKEVSKAYQAVQTEIAAVRKQVVSAVESVQQAVTDVVTWPVKKAGEMLGLTKESETQAEDDPNNVTQDNRHGEDITVDDRVHADLKKYADESRVDYASEHFTIEKRNFIRQQATITLLARMLVLKSHFKDIKDIVEQVEKRVEKMEAGTGGEMSGKNEAEVLRQNQDLRLAWFKLLGFQKMIEAVKLEFAANQSIAGMKLVKKVPSVETGEESK